MKTKTVNALKELFSSLGGNFSDVSNINNIPDMISEISTLDISSGGGSSDDADIVSALKDIYVADGGNADDVANVSKISDMLMYITYLLEMDNAIEVLPVDGETEVYNKQVKDFQLNCYIYNHIILGYWNEVENGFTDSGPLSETGYYLAVTIINSSYRGEIEVGIELNGETTIYEQVEGENYVILKIDEYAPNQYLVINVTQGNIHRTLKYAIYSE